MQVFYNFRQTKEEQVVQSLLHLIAQEQAERLAQRRLRDQNILYYCMTACDLHTQSAYLTESSANNYEPAAWKVRHIYHAEKEDRLPGSDLCYIAIPKAKPHVIW